MNTLQQIKTWSATHHPRWLVFLRIALGLFLFAKGITFMHDTQLLERVIYGGQSPQENTTHFLPILICWANLLSGFLLMVGLATRLVALIQVPILIGAIVFITAQKGGGYMPQSELWLAILTLLLVILFFIEGSGPISLDAYFKNNRSRDSQGRNLP
ncbi:MAG TPA: DoxX family protein [Puia sp.]|nr:DoxX family protein [Puia sp.]